MHKIKFGNITKEFPKSIAEFTGPQFRYFSFLEMNRQMGKITMADLETWFVYFVLEMDHSSSSPKVIENVTRLRTLVEDYYIDQEQRDRKKPKSKIVNLNFVVNPLPVIEVEKTKLYGPKAALQDCSYEEVFVQAQNAMIDFCNTNEEEYLDRLVAILYRPLKKGKRPKFDSEEMEDQISRVAKLSPEVKFAVFLFFSSCHKFITTCSSLDIGGGNTIDVAQLFTPSKKKEKGIGPLGVIYSLAESQVFGDADKTARKNVYEVLARLVQMHEKVKQAEKDAKRKKT